MKRKTDSGETYITPLLIEKLAIFSSIWAMLRLILLFLPLFLTSCKKTETTPKGFFHEVSESLGVNFTHESGSRGEYHIREPMGSGVAVFDCNGDGRLDLFFLNGSLSGKPSGNKKSFSNQLYRQKQDGSFVNVTEESGIKDNAFSMGAAVGDIDNDGDLDLYVTNYHADALYLNGGGGTFTDITSSAGIHNPEWAASVTFFDFNLDGFLDIFVTNYGEPDSSKCRDLSGSPEYCGPNTLTPRPDVLYQNKGNGTFTDVSEARGIRDYPSRGLGVVSADFNSDGLPDLYVANDKLPNQLWIQQKDGVFQDQAPELGAALNNTGNAEAGMGIALGDIDGDADLDMYITHMRFETNTLYLNNGKQGFADDTYIRGLALGNNPYTGFGNGFFDVEHDGDLDAVLVNGRVGRHRLLTETKGYWDWYAEPNLLYQNSGDGTFKNISAQSGSFHTLIESSKGLAIADLDNDGDLDLVVSNTGGQARVFENRHPAAGHWITLDPRDKKLRRTLYGTLITISTDAGSFTRLCQPGYSYLSSNDHRVHFGVGNSSKILSIRVTWPGGEVESFAPLEVDKHHVLHKGEGRQG